MEKEVIFIIFGVKDQHSIVHNFYHISGTEIRITMMNTYSAIIYGPGVS